VVDKAKSTQTNIKSKQETKHRITNENEDEDEANKLLLKTFPVPHHIREVEDDGDIFLLFRLYRTFP
jgi:hypothetical protein